MTVILKSTETRWYDYRPMLLRDYTEELASGHIVPGCGVTEMWELYETITGENDIYERFQSDI